MSGREQPVLMTGGSRILSPEARELYLKIIHSGSTKDDYESNKNNSLRELIDLGLLIRDSDDPDLLIAADPAQLSFTLSSSWQRQALDLLSRSVALPADLSELAEAFHSSDQEGGPIEYVRGKAHINQRVQQFSAAGITEGLAMQPGGPRPPELLASGIERDLKILQQGASMRSIYNASTRYHQPTREYVSRLTREGYQFRTLDEPYARLIILNRRLAVIPVGGDEMAAFIHDPGVINFLIEEVFERNWTRALEFDGNAAIPQEVIPRLRQTIIDLLLAGTNHRVIARRLGISERTLARHIAEMREEYNVDSLFQLGYMLGRASQQRPE
ncbi:Homeodomain-like domain-containing protein [Streptomyces sp. 1114.5]|uniref:helix-turn-helix transcriptional regulator n=1 Tax=unclassified Streptomyces TaxID=2593676 RepID=UPI000BCCEC64|nr:MULTISPECIES: helix-turn-helix domain-containing protein [unclassified Streptomyces]RKT16843.1 Homeodomain-like domain-containing protein [Streptomyces sp. 1114.5]SOB83014.1 Homeodomain-like domain-containing protein [Streptomyces sp. 1331.2]